MGMLVDGMYGNLRVSRPQTPAPSATSNTDSLRLAGLARVEMAQAAVRASVSAPPAPARNNPPIATSAAPTLHPQWRVDMPPEPSVQELAAMSKAVYTPGAKPPEGWSIASSAQVEAIGLSKDMLVSGDSNFRAEVYVREINGLSSYTVAFRGSQKVLNDWVANAKQGVGLDTDHYGKALEIGDKLQAPANARITITGHSLGGGLASTASLASEYDAVTFNASGLSRNTRAAAEEIAVNNNRNDVPNIRAMYVRGEVLSAIQDGGDQAFGGWVGSTVGGTAGGVRGAAEGGLVGLRTGSLVNAVVFGLFGAERGRAVGAEQGRVIGSVVSDLPEAVGTRIPMDPVRPDYLPSSEDSPTEKHKIGYVIASLPD